MAKRKENHCNNNVIIDNKVVSVSDLQTNAKSASMRFLVLVLGITLLASMVVPYLSMAAAATSTSNAFNGAVIPGYSMGGLELTAYGIDLNSWGKVESPCFVKSNYGIWNIGNLPKNYRDVEQQFVEDNSENTISSQVTANRLTNVSDKSTGWYQLTGFTNYTNNSPNGSSQVAQNQKMDSVSPIRTASDYTYWDSLKPSSNSTNDAKITVSLVPDFIVVSKDSKGKINIVKSPDDTSSKSIVPLDSNDNTRSQAYPIYIPIKALMDKYRAEMGNDSWHSFDDLFKAIAQNPELLESVVNDNSNDLLLGTRYNDLNNKTHTIDYKKQAFNPYPYTMVFSITDPVTNQTVTSSIYENCEAYVYFSPTVVYQKYLQVKNEYNSILNNAAYNLNSDNPDAVTVVQLGYYAAALSILESYLEEALPQDATRGYVGMSEPDNIRGNPDGSDVGQGQNVFHSSGSAPEASSFKKVTYATLMWDVASTYSPTAAMNSDCALDETNAIMDNLSVFGYTNNESMDGVITYAPGVMVGMSQESNFNRRTNLTPRYKEDSSSDDLTEKILDLKKQEEQIVEQMGKMSDQDENLLLKKHNNISKQIADLTEEQKKKNEASNSNNAGIYTPVYYPIQQHKMPDNEKTYRFSILANIPYDTVINYMKNFNLAKVELSYSSNFTSSFKNVTDTFEEGNKVTAIQKLIAQYNSGDEDTGLDLSTYEAAKSIVCSPEDNVETDTGTSQDDSTEDIVRDRVDSALLGFSSGNMTSDNVHDLVDVMRALPSGKIETFYRFFNPIKSDGDDQDIFVARVTPAVTTYFPSLLVNGYENAGGAEVDQACVTSNVSFDYFSIPSFAPCFASHTASDTYYGSLNYELRAFYKKGFISTLSSKTNIPQVEEAEVALEKTNEAVKNLAKDNSLSAETMAKNIKTIFVEVKRLSAAKTLKNAYKRYKKGNHGTLNMSIIEKFYDQVFKTEFNTNFSTKNKITMSGSYDNAKKDKEYDPSKKNINKWSWNNSIFSYDDIISANKRNTPEELSGTVSGEIDKDTSDSQAISTLVSSTWTSLFQLLIDKTSNDAGNATILNDINKKRDAISNSSVDKAIQGLCDAFVGQEVIDTNVKVYERNKDTFKQSKKPASIKIQKQTIIDEWNYSCKSKKSKKYKADDNGKLIENSDKKSDKKSIKKDTDSSYGITDIYWQTDSTYENNWFFDTGAHLGKTMAVIEQDPTSHILKFGTENNREVSTKAVSLAKDSTTVYGPVYSSNYPNILISNDYLTTLDSLMLKENAKYYWDDYKNIEKSNAVPETDGDLFGDEANNIFTAGFNAEAKIWSAYSDEITDDKYIKDVQKSIDEACKELFKDLINTAKNTQLLQQSMPSQMQNCLAWADYQNASDSEAQYQADPTDTVDINLDTNPKDDYDKANLITGKASLEKAGYEIQPNGSVKPTASVTGATNSAIQARMERGVEGSTWTSSVQPACYTITAIVTRIESMQSSGVSYPYSNIYSGRLRSGADQYALLQAHVIDYTSIESGISGDLKTRVHGQPVSITNPNYGALPDFLNILGTIGGLLAEASSGFANLTGGMFEDAMWNGNGESATRVATSDNQTDDGTIDTKKYDGTGNIERKGSMWVLDSTGGQSFYTLVQSLALVLVLVSLLYIAFKNFYEYTRPAGASASIGEKDEAGKKSAAAESKILAATQLKVVMPRAIIAVFMIGLPPMSGAGFQGGNFLLLQMLSSIFNQISHVFMNLNGQSVMNLWLNTGADLLSDNPGIGEYIAYALAMFVIGAMFVVGTLAVLLADVMLIFFYIIGPLMWALYVWPYNDTTSKTKNPDGIIAKLTSRMKFAWTGGRVGNKAPEGMIECYCETAMLNVMWSVIFWAITIVFTGVTGTIAADTSSTPGNTATLAGAATVSNATYAQSALMSTGNYYASASVAHADGLFNAGILPMPAWVRMLIAAALAVVVFMLMIRMASSMFKKSLGNTFAAVSAVGGAIRGGAVGGMLGREAQLAKVGQNTAAIAGNAHNIADRARSAADNFRKASVRGRLHQIGNGARALGNHGANALRKAGQAANTAGQYVSGDKSLTDGFTNAVRNANRLLNDNAAANQKDNSKRLHGTRDSLEALQNALGENDVDKAQEILDTMTPEQKRQLSHYAPSLFERNRNGHDLRLRSGVTNHDFDRARRELDDRIEIADARADRHARNSNNALTPEQVKARNLAASGIDNINEVAHSLLSSDSDDRTKNAARRRLEEYSRRAYGESIDWSHGEQAAVSKLLSRTAPTADERATRISDAISNAAATGREEARSFANRHQIGAYEGDSSQVITRELGRTNDTLSTILPAVATTAADTSNISNALNTHIERMDKVYIDRGETPIEARAHALRDLEAQYGHIDIAEARRLSSELSNGGQISNGEAIRLELFKQSHNIGESTFGDRVIESGAGFNSSNYLANASAIPDALINPAARDALNTIAEQQAYQNYVDHYSAPSATYHASYERILNNVPAGRERRELQNIITASPFNALLSSGAPISKAMIDTAIMNAETSGHPIAPEAISAMEEIYSDVQKQVVENDADFKNHLLANLPASSSYSSADDAISALDGRQIDTNDLTATVRNSVNDQLTAARSAESAATARVRTLTSNIAMTGSQIRHARSELKKATAQGDAAEQTRWNDEIKRLLAQRATQKTDLADAQRDETSARYSVTRIQGHLDSITATNQAPNPLSPTGRDDH